MCREDTSWLKEPSLQEQDATSSGNVSELLKTEGLRRNSEIIEGLVSQQQKCEVDPTPIVKAVKLQTGEMCRVCKASPSGTGDSKASPSGTGDSKASPSGTGDSKAYPSSTGDSKASPSARLQEQPSLLLILFWAGRNFSSP
ncbi:UNVERIFIED_CONTAM: hypothetical protein FKN15_032968 [Acipenser sinensis]